MVVKLSSRIRSSGIMLLMCVGNRLTNLSIHRTDHVEMDVNQIGLADDKLRMIFEAYNSPSIQSIEFKADAALTHWNITPHQMYRYLVSGDWTGMYNGKSIVEAVVDTVKWRKSFGIHILDLHKIFPVLERSVVYVNGADKNGSALLYINIGNLKKRIDADLMISLLMYSVERADKDSTLGSGQFVAIIDLDGLSFNTAPSLEVIKKALDYLKLHYPYRLNSLIILNGGMVFNTLWTVVKPLMPPLALAKTIVLGKKEAQPNLIERVGREHLEQRYGGEIPPITDFKKYVDEGYWH